MRVLVVFAHPVETSFSAALHRTTVEALKAAGHEVDDCDLYAEDFQPVMSRQERIDYHDTTINTKPVQNYVDRLKAAEGLVLVHPVWNYGYPAIMKGFFDRVFITGVNFVIENGDLKPNLRNVRRMAAVTTYGGSHFRSFLMGDPPRRQFRRAWRAQIHPLARTNYLALYAMDKQTDAGRAAFVARVDRAMRAF